MPNTDLLKQIELVRKKMVSVGMSKGFTSADTIKLSKMLDSLLNSEMRLHKRIAG
jgi:hypothetical protein